VQSPGASAMFSPASTCAWYLNPCPILRMAGFSRSGFQRGKRLPRPRSANARRRGEIERAEIEARLALDRHMAERHVGGLARLDGKRDADRFGKRAFGRLRHDLERRRRPLFVAAAIQRSSAGRSCTSS